MKVDDWNWIEWTPELQNKEENVYYWGNDHFILGIGRSSKSKKNNRTNPEKGFKKVKTIKDAGKTFYTLFMGKLTDQEPKLYYAQDNSKQNSKISSKLETELKKYHKFVDYKNEQLKKQEFIEEYVKPAIEGEFGVKSEEAKLLRLAGPDGDLWGKFTPDEETNAAMDNIMNKFLWQK